MNTNVSIEEFNPPIIPFHEFIVQWFDDYESQRVSACTEKDLEFIKHKLQQENKRHRIAHVGRSIEIDWPSLNNEIGDQFTEAQKGIIRDAVERQLRKG